MQISRSVYMGIEALARLAARGADTPCTTQGLAEWINQPVSYTETLMARLLGAGLVRAGHGPGDGYYLARPAHRITVAEVFRAFDEPHDMPSRPLNGVTLEPLAIQDLRGTDLLWESFKSHFLLFLNEILLTDITPDSAGEWGSEAAKPAATMAQHMQSKSVH